MMGYVVFTDLQGFSQLSEPETKIFYKEILEKINHETSEINKKAKIINTWGDAFFLVFEKGKDAIDWMMKFKALFKQLDFKKLGIKKLTPRIAGHVGEFEIFYDPILKKENALGRKINTVARIEPVTRPGEIYVTLAFKNAIDNLPEKITSITFDELGMVPLAKGFGEETLYRMRANDEKEQIIDKLLQMDLSGILPETPPLEKSEIETIDFLKTAPDKSHFENIVKNSDIKNKSAEFKIEVAKLCMKFGDYENALSRIEESENYSLDVDGVRIYPYKYNVSLQKTKANCLTRLGKYGESSNIVYGLWKFGVTDSDTLCMLAAQYKRMAIWGEKKEFIKENVNTELLKRSRDLYIEAFRRDINHYYPAINAAYLYKMIGGIEKGRGTKLAQYISNAWEDSEPKDWWLSTYNLSGGFRFVKTNFPLDFN